MLEAKSARLCKSCGQPIAEKRLKALPNANLCTECQSRRDINTVHVAPVNVAALNTLRGNDGYDAAAVTLWDRQRDSLSQAGYLASSGLSTLGAA